MAKGYFGDKAGPGAHMRAYVECRTAAQEEGRAYVQYKRSIRVDDGNFGGTIVDRNWGGQVQLYGPNWYGDSGWVDYGWVGYGGQAVITATISYLSWSGVHYNSSVTARYSPDVPMWTPNAVSQCSAVLDGGKIKVKWRNNNTTTRPYAGIYVDVSVDGGGFTLHKDVGGGDTECEYACEPNRVYEFRVLPHNAAGNAGSHTYTGKVCTLPAPPTGVKVARLSDTENVVTFGHGSGNDDLYLAHDVQRQMDGGAWSDFAAVEPAGTRCPDRSTSANHSWRYRVRSRNSAGASDWVYTGTVYNTPAAPGKIAMARVSNTRVRGTFENPANTATSAEIERSQDMERWTAVRTVEGHVTSFEDDPGGGTWYYRVRNARGGLRSAWTASSGIVTICAPAAPTVTSPSSSQVIPKTQASIAVTWRHNPIDGSAQTAAQWRWSTDGKTWTTVDVSGEASSATLANSFAVNTRLSVQVRTRGAHADFGPWSPAVATYVRQVPTLSIEEPADGFTVETVPVHVRVRYSDPSGTMAAGTLTICDAAGTAVYSRDLAAGLEFDIPASEWLPADSASYRLAATARSSSTLQGSAERSVSVRYSLPAPAIVDAVPDPATGRVAITVHAGVEDGAAPMESASVWRNVGGVRTLLADGLHDGAELTDEYAPLNTDYAYETASIAASGAVRETRFPGRVDSGHVFVYWSGGIARGRYNPADEIAVEPEFSTFRLAGRRYPVGVSSDRVAEKHTASVTLNSRGEALAFYRAVCSGERLVMKTLYGFVFPFMATAKLAPSLGNAERQWSVSLEATRLDGEGL